MRRSRWIGAVGLVLAMSMGGAVDAIIIQGCVLLDENCDGSEGAGIPGVTVQLKDSEGDVISTTESDEVSGLGVYQFGDLGPGQYQICVVLPGGFTLGSTTCVAGGGSTCDSLGNPIIVTLAESANVVRIKANFLLCPEELCWMTGGGVKFEPAAEGFLAGVASRAKKGNDNGGGPSDSVGGNVAPSCSLVPGQGGQWNHVAHSLGLHLTGKEITEIRCGNVDGIEPGTESPVCSVNYIEFLGNGVVSGMGNNSIDDIDVCFFGRVEDHNEPGNSNANEDPLEVDRYFLRVFDCDTGALIMNFLVDEDGVDDGDVDPLAITGGNFQIHCTSCDGRPTGNGGAGSLTRGGTSLPDDIREGLRLGTYFLRGDLNVDGGVDISDAVHGLNYLFNDLEAPRCMDAADANDDGQFNISDPVALLNGLFANGPMLAPFPVAGIDETPDALDCGLLLAK